MSRELEADRLSRRGPRRLVDVARLPARALGRAAARVARPARDPLLIHHASGHAFISDLQRLVHALAPERVVPIHSSQETGSRTFSRVSSVGATESGGKSDVYQEESRHDQDNRRQVLCSRWRS